MGDFQKKATISGICDEEGYAFSRCMITNPLHNYVNFRDIAKSLSRQPMYQGMTHNFYSAAQHSILISDIIYDHVSQNPEMMLLGLLYFADKTYTGMTSCNTTSGAGNKKQSIHISGAIHKRAGLLLPDMNQNKMIQKAIEKAHHTAKRDVLPIHTFGEFADATPYRHPIRFINELSVQEIFLERLSNLISQCGLTLPEELEEMV